MTPKAAAQIVSEERFQHVLTAIGDVLYSVDAETEEFSYLSPAFERLLGYTQDDIQKMGGRRAFMAQVIEQDAFSEQQRIFDELRTEEAADIPVWVSWWRCKDGSLRCFEDYSIPLYKEGRLVSTDGVLRDVTRQKKAEAERERRATQATLLYEVGRRVSSELELEVLLSEIVKAVRDAFDYFSVMLVLYDKESGRLNLEAVTGGYADVFPADLSLAVGEGMIGRTAEIGASVLSGDVTQDAHYVRAADEHTKSELAVPIKSGNRLIGVLDLQSDQFDAFDESDIMIMEAVADQVATAIENARLYKAAQKELVERERLQREVIEAQQRTLRELSTPIIPIMERIIVAPLIGSIDLLRARDLTRALLAGIRQQRAKVVILDITGVPLVDSNVAEYLNKTIQAARLKGARTIVTGISDAVAETIVDLGIDWSGIETLADLQTGLIVALSSQGIKLTR